MRSQIEKNLQKIIPLAINEDAALHDITSDLILSNEEVLFSISPREEIILCGVDAVKICFDELKNYKKFSNEKIKLEVLSKDGDVVKQGETMLRGVGSAKLIFSAERIILNIIQHLSGVATLTNKFVKKLNNKNIKILDTRKTLPGLRSLEKYAVLIGGGKNHRINLSDMILIKDNHIASVGGVLQALLLAKKNNKNLKIEIECDNLNQVKEVISSPRILLPDIIMLDNMTIGDIKSAIKIINKHCKIEVSGGINLKNIENYSNLDIDFISVGSLTNSASNVDIGLDAQK
jgi:nicotinate-nucleotide pyrophosphorylase (carboxylating)